MLQDTYSHETPNAYVCLIINYTLHALGWQIQKKGETQQEKQNSNDPIQFQNGIFSL